MVFKIRGRRMAQAAAEARRFVGMFAACWVLASAPLTGGRVAAQDEPKAEKPPTFAAADVEFFQKEVEPILKARCLKCHGGEDKIRGDFRVTSRSAVIRGGELGPAVSLDKPDESMLLKAVNYDGLEMPPTGRLPAAEVAILTRWVKAKLPWTPGKEDEPLKPRSHGLVVDEKAKSYWAYQPIKRPAVPAVKRGDWVRNPIDAFLLAKLEAAGLSPNEPADPAALIRRTTYDLTGLPPKPEDVDAFVANPTPAAYEALLDRLLDSPQYGEKWGRHWLDLVRYAETHGYERDSAKPFAWRYRDYVVDSFNKDKPYDQFVREQLAGDELDEVTAETLTATGYYRLGIWDDEPADRPLAHYDVLDGIVGTTAQVMLGMSMNCVRCHDHKRDPIPHRDYYKLLAFFHGVSDMNVGNLKKVATDQDRATFAVTLRERQQQEGKLYAEIYQMQQQLKQELARRGGADSEQALASDLVDVQYRFYRDSWDALPDFEGLKFEASGVVGDNVISLEPASRPEAIGLVFEGKLKVPAAGVYVFDADATEGIRLSVAGQKVIDRPGRGTHRVEGTAKLEAGFAPIRVEYFNHDKKPRLQLGWRSDKMPRRSLSEVAGDVPGRAFLADSRAKGQVWSYVTKKPETGWEKPGFEDMDWRRGEGGFGQPGTPGAVVRTPWNSSDIWMRTKFRIDNAGRKAPKSLALSIHHDEDVDVYLNGHLVYAAKGFLTQYERRGLDVAALQYLADGENVLAVHCRQTGGGQYVDVGLEDGRASASIVDLVKRHGAATWGEERAKQYATLVAQLDALRKEKAPEPGLEVMCVEERGVQPTHVLLRGNPGAKGEAVEPGVPEVLGGASFVSITSGTKNLAQAPKSGTSGRRLALAHWITSRDNPLTSRVLANRLWQHHFGVGIVPTPNDFGQLGELPTHPELLDWLAGELVDGGWKLKRMHKLLMLSSAYRMSSQGTEAALAKDPANHLWWRYPMRRLTAEEVRDSILAASGQLNLKAGGPSIYPPIPKEVLAGQSRPGAGWGSSSPEEAARRSIYIHVKRSLLVPILETHDVADTDSSCPVRYTTTVPSQALGMMNGEFANQQAAAFAGRLEREASGDLPKQVRLALRLASGRTPSDAEVKSDVDFVNRIQAELKLSAPAALTQYCLLVLNTNAFLYLD